MYGVVVVGRSRCVVEEQDWRDGARDDLPQVVVGRVDVVDPVCRTHPAPVDEPCGDLRSLPGESGHEGIFGAEARNLFRDFTDVRITTRLGHGDLLDSEAGQRHQGALLSMARAIWPRRLLRTFAPSLGLFMLIEARK